MHLDSRFTRLGLHAALAAILLAGCAVEDGDATATSSDALGIGPVAPTPTVIAPTPPPPPTFTIRALGTTCLDVGGQASWAPGVPVTLYRCNGSVAQQFVVQEANLAHDVNLRVGTTLCVGIRGNQPVAGAILELQTCNLSDEQLFALDGDSIMSGPTHRPIVRTMTIGGTQPIQYPVDRSLVWKPQNDVTNSKTPMVLGPRTLNENEYLRVVATDGTNRAPHSGFMRPVTVADFSTDVWNASWGNVIEIPENAVWDITIPDGSYSTQHDGVTIRGYRKLTDNGPQLRYTARNSSNVFDIVNDTMRLTGFRLEGPSDSTDDGTPQSGIHVPDDHTVILDHLEVSKFPTQAIVVEGLQIVPDDKCSDDDVLPSTRPTRQTVADNFIHHNQMKAKGYGVDVSKGAFARVDGNVEYANRHSVTSDYLPWTGYDAEDNLVLSGHPTYADGLQTVWDFDVHGSHAKLVIDGVTVDDAWFKGGIAGDHTLIRFNTFLASDHTDITIRGVPCRPSEVTGNVFPQSTAAAVGTIDEDGAYTDSPVNVSVHQNIENAHPTNAMSIGDFDGDGIDDLFMGTGAAWYYSSGGQSEWRFLRRAPETTTQVVVGDLDGDGRADVVKAGAGTELDVSWGGVSSWQFLTRAPSAQPIGNYWIGNFDGDRLHGDDLFVAGNGSWFVAPSGHTFALSQTSSLPFNSLEFGDFDGDGKTDVLGVVGGKWQISSGATQPWRVTGNSTPNTGLLSTIVGDVDGDHDDDVIEVHAGYVNVSYGATTPYVHYDTDGATVFGVGRFHGGAKGQLISWDDHQLDFKADLYTPRAFLSRQQMR